MGVLLGRRYRRPYGRTPGMKRRVMLLHSPVIDNKLAPVRTTGIDLD
jgi:hypothetical protein